MNKHDFKIKGYIIEYRTYIKELKKWTNWNIYYNRKFYTSKQIAEEALSHIGSFSVNLAETRIVPLYIINYEKKQ